MSFEDALAAAARETTALLDALLPPSGRLLDAMRYAALGPGKRLRPFLVIESAALFGVPRDRALRVGAALECVHCYSLVHDDLPAMDNDELRRGHPTTHRAFDEATAILAGDALLTFAFEILGAASTHPDASVRVTLVTDLAKAAGFAGMAGGQMLDIEANADITRIQAMKTGALFSFACASGAVLAGADSAPLRHYAENIGLAFQIADDILDEESNATVLGKATQKDKILGKATFVQQLGLAGAKARAAALTESAIAALESYGPRAATLREAAHFMVTRQR